MRAAVDQIQSLTNTPARALANVRARMQTAVDRDVRALARRNAQ
jgi:hypothetical protein